MWCATAAFRVFLRTTRTDLGHIQHEHGERIRIVSVSVFIRMLAKPLLSSMFLLSLAYSKVRLQLHTYQKATRFLIFTALFWVRSTGRTCGSPTLSISSTSVTSDAGNNCDSSCIKSKFRQVVHSLFYFTCSRTGVPVSSTTLATASKLARALV